MTMKHHGDLCFSSGEYTDKQGQTKKRWEKFGTVMQDDQSGRMSIHIPLFEKWFSIFPKENKPTPQHGGFVNGEPVYTQPGSQQQQYKNDQDLLPF